MSSLKPTLIEKCQTIQMGEQESYYDRVCTSTHDYLTAEDGTLDLGKLLDPVQREYLFEQVDIVLNAGNIVRSEDLEPFVLKTGDVLSVDLAIVSWSIYQSEYLYSPGAWIKLHSPDFPFLNLYWIFTYEGIPGNRIFQSRYELDYKGTRTSLVIPQTQEEFEHLVKFAYTGDKPEVTKLWDDMHTTALQIGGEVRKKYKHGFKSHCGNYKYDDTKPPAYYYLNDWIGLRN